MPDQLQGTFSEKELVDPIRGVVAILFKLDGKNIRCAVSFEALQDLARSKDGSAEEALSIFQSHRYSTIEPAIERKLMSRQFEADGSILVRTDDLNG